MELLTWYCSHCSNMNVDPTWGEFEIEAGHLLEAARKAEQQIAEMVRKGEVEGDCFLTEVTMNR